MHNAEYYKYSEYLFKILNNKLFIFNLKTGQWAGKEILPEFTRNLPDDLIFQLIRKMLTKIALKKAHRIMFETALNKLKNL